MDGLLMPPLHIKLRNMAKAGQIPSRPQNRFGDFLPYSIAIPWPPGRQIDLPIIVLPIIDLRASIIVIDFPIIVLLELH